jgi:hypothetical protein
MKCFEVFTIVPKIQNAIRRHKSCPNEENLIWCQIYLLKGYKKLKLHVPFGCILKKIWLFDILKECLSEI